MTAGHDAAFGDWTDAQHEHAAAFVRELGRLIEWRDAALAADRADYERATERTWRAFRDGLWAAIGVLGDSQASMETFWLNEVKPGHAARPDPPEGVPGYNTLEAGIERAREAAGYPGPVPAIQAAYDRLSEGAAGHLDSDGGPLP